ncbi:MAG: hypothetical protein LBP40_08205 [Campylobacteraceae bacterium]|jgi:hypothetical protein|nr:hypothetical protein [Campylobacteraceae bacterium]
MIIIGHNLVSFKPFYKIKSNSEAAKIPSDFTAIFKFAGNEEIIKFCQKNSINFAVETQSIKEALLANALGASYIVVNDKKAAKNIQNLAEDYLFDAKILLKIKNENEIEKAAKSGIDGILFLQGIINGDF